jgi:hypothetical protein
MGLDNFASHFEELTWLSPEDCQAFSDADINLCIGGSPGSFRGREYETLVLNITGVWLGKPWIMPEIVQEMYLMLMKCDPETLLERYRQIDLELDQEYSGDGLEKITEDILELRKFFQICVDRGLGPIGQA